VGAIRDNGRGVVGVAPGVRIMPVHCGYTLAEMASAIRVAADHGARVINNSWGFAGAASAEIESAIEYALGKQCVVLFAAGNGPDRPPYVYDVAFPACLTDSKDIICVGSTSLADEHTCVSSADGNFTGGSSYVGPGPDVCAPGPWSYTTDRTGSAGDNDGSKLDDADYRNDFTGTSSSTPKTAGVVALMLSANPNLTPTQVKKILMETADDVDAPGPDDKTGAGRVNAYKAVIAARAAQ
jgi:thermitase